MESTPNEPRLVELIAVPLHPLLHQGEVGRGRVGPGLVEALRTRLQWGGFSSPSLQWPHSSDNFLIMSPRHRREEESCSVPSFYEAGKPSLIMWLPRGQSLG